MIVPTIKGKTFVDDRGSLRFVNDFSFADTKIKRFYQVENHERGFIRAWHGHKIEGKYVYVVKGSAWVAAIDMEDTTVVESQKKLGLIIVRGDNVVLISPPPR